MRRGVGSILLLPIIVGCGADNGAPRAEPSTDAPFTARFNERTTYDDAEIKNVRGAFDWDAMRGWADERTSVGTHRTVQAGDDCFERSGEGPWKRSRASDPEGTCSAALFMSPKSEFELLQKVAGLEAVGKAEIRGIRTTHYQGVLSIGAVQGTIEVWVDDEGIVRRSLQKDEDNTFKEIRDYYDFGEDVTVNPPKLPS